MLVEHLSELGLIAAAISFLMSLLIVFSERWHGKLSHDHDLAGVQKVHTTAVPRIGGLAVLVGVIVSAFVCAYFAKDALFAASGRRVGLLLLMSAPAFLAGIVEDFTKKVSVKLRLSATVLSSLLASAALGATVNELNIWGVDSLLTITPIAVVVTAVVVAGGANAINIIDGFNGLSTSTLMVMAAGLSVVAWQSHDQFVLLLGVICIGATLGFFLMNYPFGKLFLGDGGAYFLGFWVSEMAVLLVCHSEVNAWQVLSICAYPVIEVMFSIYRRKFVKKVSPGAPDALHLHTLVYRRVVYPRVPRTAARPWLRNASVAPFIVPVVAVCVALSAFFGQTIGAAILMVVAQVLVYIVIYRRLVHGRWVLAGLFSLEDSQSPQRQS
jgi:UDP-N-acetylmuramyl pentapeptide phosphotransferase/UDP-N-acetylglucosamine-1-phosphate transferase